MPRPAKTIRYLLAIGHLVRLAMASIKHALDPDRRALEKLPLTHRTAARAF